MEAQIRIHIIDSNSNNIVDTHIQVIDSNNTLLNVKIIKENGSLYIKGLSKNEKYQIIVSADGYEQQEQNVILYYETTVLVFILGKSGSSYYQISGAKIPYNRKENELVIIPSFNVKEKLSFRPQINQVKNQFNLEEISEIKNKHVSTTEESLLFFVRPTDDKVYREVLNSIHNLEIGIPCLELNNNSGKYTLVSDEIKILFSVKPSNKVLLELNEKFGLKASIQKDKGIYRFWVTILNYDIFDIITKLNSVREKYGIESASPVIYYPMYLDSQIIPTDFLFPEQWDFRISQIPEAWYFLKENTSNPNNQFGAKDIVVAVSDPDGIEISHPDLSGQLWDGSDKVLVSIDFVNLTQPVTAVDDHGTQCAGAVLANVNNPSLNPGFSQGIAGIAGGSRLAALRVAVPMDQQSVAESYMWLCGVSVDSSRTGFPTILNKSVDVTSGSYLVGPLSPISDEMKFALDFATDFGRMGRGLAMFFSAGNNNTDISTQRPWAAYNRTMGIGASTLGDIGTKEIWADYSNFGPEINFCAISGGRYEHNPPDTWRVWTTIRNGHGESLGFPELNPTTVQDTVISQPSIDQVEVNDGSLFIGQQTLIVAPPGDISPLGIYPEVRLIINVTGNVITVAPPFNNNHVGHTVLGGKRGYTPNFSGTSYSTPVAAGIAALILSVKPSLSWIELRAIISSTARKINLDENIKKWQDRHPDKVGANSILDSAGNLILETPIVSTSLTTIATAPSNLNKALNFTTNTLTVISNAGFDIGDTIFISDGTNSEIKIIEAKSGNNKLIIDALRYSYNVGTVVQKGKYKPVFNVLFGYGRINAYEALKKAHEYSHSWRDLVIRDHIEDNGTTNTQVNHYPIHSPDIWIRNTPDPTTPVPPFNQEGPHENPKPDNDRYIFVRIKNIGNGNLALPANQKLKNLDAWVHICVALSDGNIPPIDTIVNPSPGINSPFIFPGDLHSANSDIAAKSWMEDRLSLSTGGQNKISGTNGIMSGDMKVYHVAVNSTEPNIHIPADTIPHHDPSNPEASSYVVRVKWDELDLPPIDTNHKIYLLAYVSPVDGERQGRGAELNNNMSFREIAFADFDFLDSTGSTNLNTIIDVDEFGTNVSTPFNIKVKQSIGSFNTENVTLEIIRERSNGTKDHLIFLYNDSSLTWEILNMNDVTVPITWASIDPPVETATDSPATLVQTDITFSGNFNVSKEFSKIEIRATIRGERDNTLWVHVAEDSYLITVNEVALESKGLSSGIPPLFPKSYAFADMSNLTQTQEHSFGPKFDSETEEFSKFSVTSRFEATVKTNAYAIVKGKVMVQPSDVVGTVNLVLRPFTQPIPGFTPVKYIIYRGLKASSFINISNSLEVTPKDTTNSEWITELYDIHESQNGSGAIFLSKAIGYDPTITGNVSIDQEFFKVDPDLQLPMALKGVQLGEFDINQPFGIDIILEEGEFTPNFNFVRSSHEEIDISEIDNEFLKKLEKEKILNFIDPAAFYGLHIRDKGLVEYRTPSNTKSDSKGQEIYDDIVDKFFTKNTTYVDIRNELGNSYNFFENYSDGSDDKFNIQIKTGASASFEAQRYGTEGWPILILNSISLTTTDKTHIFSFKLRADENPKPILYIEHGGLKDLSKAEGGRFIEGNNLLLSGELETEELTFNQPNTDDPDENGNKINTSWLLKLHYSRQIDSSVDWSSIPKAVKTESYLDNIFGPVNLDIIPWNSDNNIKWIGIQDKKYIDASINNFGYIAERGIAVEDTAAPGGGRVIFYASALDSFKTPILFPPVNGLTGGTSKKASFFEEAMIFADYRLYFDVILDEGIPITSLKLEPSTAESAPAQAMMILGLSRDEFNTLKALTGLSDGYPATAVLEEIGSGLGFTKYKVGMQGLDTDGKYKKVFPYTNIVTYTTDGLLFYTDAFSVDEPLPTVYIRNAEEHIGVGDRTPSFFPVVLKNVDLGISTLSIDKDIVQWVSPGDIVNVKDDTGAVHQLIVSNSSLNGTGQTELVVTGNIASLKKNDLLFLSKKSWEDHIIDLDRSGSSGIFYGTEKMKDIVDSFAIEVDNVINDLNAHLNLEAIVNSYAGKIFDRALLLVKHVTLDDRILYWTRLKMEVILKSHEFMLQSFSSRNELIKLFEERSRGYKPDFSSLPVGITKLILITGFDPFQLFPLEDRTHKNPSGVAALKFHGETYTLGTETAYIQAVVFPVRYKDFDDGIVEQVVEPFMPSSASPKVDMIMSLSLNGSNPYFDLERYAGRYRGGFHDNSSYNNIRPKPIGNSEVSKEFYETTLPVDKIVIGPFDDVINQKIFYDQSYKTLDGTTQDHPITGGPNTNIKEGVFPIGLANEGSGSNYLSNEVFYRIARSRSHINDTLPTGHYHLAKPYLPEKFPAFTMEKILDEVKNAILRSLNSI